MEPSIFPWYVFLTVLSVVWGACIGSFLNVCIHRIPREQSVVKPRSHCPQCKRDIPWYLNIPVASYLMLRGRCRFCGTRISPRYMLVECLVAALFLLVWLKYDVLTTDRPLGLTPMTDGLLVPVYWLAVSGLVLGTFVDFEHLIIPDRVTIGGIVAGFVLSGLVPAMHGATSMLGSMIWSALGILIGGGTLWGLAIFGRFVFKKEAMGFGDVKLLAAIGAFLGTRAVLFTVLFSSLAGSIVGLSLVAFANRRLRSRIPYGPYIALAAVVWILWGPGLWNMYVDLCTPDLPVGP